LLIAVSLMISSSGLAPRELVLEARPIVAA
jgi:hypothetical protein